MVDVKALLARILNWIGDPYLYRNIDTSKSTQTSDVWRNLIGVKDNQNVSYGFLTTVARSNGMISTGMYVRKSLSGKNHDNQIRVDVDASGNPAYYISGTPQFRSAIGLGTQLYSNFAVTEITKKQNVPTGYQSFSVSDITKSGWRPLGVVGFDVTGPNSSKIYPLKARISDIDNIVNGKVSLFAGVNNTNSATANDITFHWHVLWCKVL